MRRGVDVVLLSRQGYFRARLVGPISPQAALRPGRLCLDDAFAVRTAGANGRGKIAHQRQVLQRQRRLYPRACACPPRSAHRHGDERVVVGRVLVLLLAHLDAALARDLGRVHHVDRLERALEEALEDDGRERARVELARVAGVFHAHELGQAFASWPRKLPSSSASRM